MDLGKVDVGHIVVHHKGAEQRKVDLGNAPITIGRDKDNTLPLPGTSVSRHHARLLPDHHGGWRLIDLGSANGTRLNGKKVQDSPIHHQDRLDIGEYTLNVNDPKLRKPAVSGTPVTSTPAPAASTAPPPDEGIKLLARGGSLDGREFPLAGPVRIGRGEGNDIRIDLSQVSGKHARLVKTKGGFRVEDLGSTNGTRVNGNLVKSHVLKHGDEVEITPVRFLYLTPEKPHDHDLQAFRKRRMAHDRLFVLTAENGRDEHKVYPLPFTVGREKGNNLTLEDDSVSGTHARILMEDHHLVLEDLGATNGTLVNGKKITKARVGHGSEIEFGRLYFLLRDVDYGFPTLERGAPSKVWGIAVAAALVALLASIAVPFFLKGRGASAKANHEPNLLKINPGFESLPGAGGSLEGWDLTGEKFSLDHQEAGEGTTSLRVELSTTALGWARALASHVEAFDVKPGHTYRLAARLRANYSSGVAGLRIDWDGKGAVLPFVSSLSDLVTGDTNWLDVDTSVTAPEGAQSATLTLFAYGNGGVDWFDHIRFSPAPRGRSSSIRRLDSGKLRSWVNRRGQTAFALESRICLKDVGLVFWNRARKIRASQNLCLPAVGFPRTSSGEFFLRAEAVKLNEGLTVPFEEKFSVAPDGFLLRYRVHADAGYLAVGDRIAVAFNLLEPLRQVILTSARSEEKLARSSFGSVAEVSRARLLTETDEIILGFDPPMTVNGLVNEKGEFTVYASAGVTRADLGRLLEVNVRVSVPPDRLETRAAETLQAADGKIKAGKLGAAFNLYEDVATKYADLDAGAQARSRMANIEKELERLLEGHSKALAEFEASPSPAGFSAFLFRLDETEGMFSGMAGFEKCAALREHAFEVYEGTTGPAFREARRLLAEARAAYETDDWVLAETLCARLLTEVKDDALAPGARAILSEIRRRQANTEECDAWVEGRLGGAKDLEGRGETATALQMYREILRRYPRGEWAGFAEDQIRRLEK